MSLQQYLSLAIAGVAMLVYNLKPELDADGMPVEGVHAFESRAPTLASYASDRATLTGRASRNGRTSAASAAAGTRGSSRETGGSAAGSVASDGAAVYHFCEQ